MDCMEGMKEFPDRYFDLAIVDPPYGIGADVAQNNNKGKQGYKLYKSSDWDREKPDKIYFNELLRISSNQIICGGNYFAEHLPSTSGWVVWDKIQRLTLSDGELIYTSFNKALRIFQYGRGANQGFNNKQRFHPTQKPVQLYKWLLNKYAKPDMKIIDTHVGSGSSIIAFLDFGCEWIGFEIDEDYHRDASKRIEIHKQQGKLF